MTRQIPIERLHDLLRIAADEGIIEGWAVEGRHVVFVHGGQPNPVPAFEAAAFLESLFRQRQIRRGEITETEDR